MITLSGRCAEALADLGLKPGDRVAAQVENGFRGRKIRRANEPRICGISSSAPRPSAKKPTAHGIIRHSRSQKNVRELIRVRTL